MFSPLRLELALGLVLVFGLGPIPSFGVAGAGLATLISQSCRCLALIIVVYASNKGVRWVWPLPGSRVAATAAKLIQLTGPIAASEVLWGMSFHCGFRGLAARGSGRDRARLRRRLTPERQTLTRGSQSASA